MKCEICGREIKMTGNNWVENNGKLYHKKCPVYTNKLNEDDKKSYNLLKEKISYYAATCPRGYISEKPMNFKYAMSIVSKMKDRGFSYDDIIYALDKVVELQEGFWGMGAVDNRIEVIISKRNDKLKKQEQIKKIANNDKAAQQIYDLSDMIKEDNDKWI